jgi:hypothetical protein
MIAELRRTAPEVDIQKVIGTGATQIRHTFPADQVPSIVLAYMAGIKATLVLTVSLVGAACLLLVFVPRKRLNADSLQGGVA